MRATFFGCWAQTTAPPVVSVITMATIPTHFRFWILRQSSGQVLDCRLSENDSSDRTKYFFFMLFSPNRKSKSGPADKNLKPVVSPSTRLRINSVEPSLKDPLRPHEHDWWNRQAKRFGGLKIDRQLKLRRFRRWHELSRYAVPGSRPV